MSIELRNCFGSVNCEWCNQVLVLSSSSDYCKCENCGGKYKEGYKPTYKNFYNFNYFWFLVKNFFS